MSYHVRRAEREITDPAELRAILARGTACTLALARDGEPYLVTLTYAYEAGTDTLFFHCGKEGQKMDFIRANPRTCATVVEDHGTGQPSCDHSYKSVVFRGTLEPVSDPGEIMQAIRLLVLQIDRTDPQAKLIRLQGGDRGFDALQVLRLKVESITGKCRLPKPPKEDRNV
jgi:nitroimidazol reductase NimA-like FMN-containing flavoprotein (pyridoxamine 5'-phosphate oxidase superfamily)